MDLVIDEDDYETLVEWYELGKYDRNIGGRARPGTAWPTANPTRTELESNLLWNRRSTDWSMARPVCRKV